MSLSPYGAPHPVAKQDVSLGRIPVHTVSTKRAVPVWLKRSIVLWAVAVPYFAYTWYEVVQNSKTFNEGRIRTIRHHFDFEPFAASSRLIEMRLNEASAAKKL